MIHFESRMISTEEREIRIQNLMKAAGLLETCANYFHDSNTDSSLICEVLSKSLAKDLRELSLEYL